MPAHKPKRLLASIHDVGPGAETAVDRLVGIFERHLGGPKFAMLVVPDHWGQHPLAGNHGFRAKLRAWSDSGVEMFVHGWFHKDYAEHSGMAGIKARHMTASEGEFLGLTRDEAAQRMRDGKALVEDIIGREAAGFIAPAWLYGEGAMEALRESGFALAEDHLRVWVPANGETVSRGPVITWASRSRARTASSLAVARLARGTFHRLRDVRVAVHPGDVTKPSLIDSIEATLGSFVARRAVGRYRDLLGST
jgi:predicted deacetylase